MANWHLAWKQEIQSSWFLTLPVSNILSGKASEWDIILPHVWACTLVQRSSRHWALSGPLCFSSSSLQGQQILQGAGFPSDFWDLSKNLQQQLVSLPHPVLSLPYVWPHSTSPLTCSSTLHSSYLFWSLTLFIPLLSHALTLPLLFFSLCISSL